MRASRGTSRKKISRWRSTRIALALGVIGIACFVNSRHYSAWAADEKAPAKDQPAEPAAQQAADPQAVENPRGDEPLKAEAAPTKVGQFIVVEQPINDKVDLRVRHMAGDVIKRAGEVGKAPVLVFEIQAGRSDFGRALDLAKYIYKINGATTVAYLPKTVTGHALLVALACDEIVMHEDAEIGEAGRDEGAITPDIRSGYVEICRRRTMPVAVVLGMLDKSLEVHLMKSGVSEEYALASEVDALRARGFVDVEVFKKAGELGLFSAREARTRGFAKLLVRDRKDLAEAYGLPRESLVENPLAGGVKKTIRIDLKGPTAGRAVQAARQVEDAVASGKNFILLWIDSPGGAPDDSLALAGALARVDPKKHLTVAYIPREARADAAIVAMACDVIVMAPDAVLGGSGESFIPKDQIPGLVASIEDIVEQKSRSISLAQAIVDPDLAVFRYVRDGDGVVRFLSEKAAAELPDAERWKKGAEITHAGKPFETTGRAAHDEFALVSKLAGDFAELKAHFGLEHDPQMVEPGWADTLVDALARDEVAWILFAVGFAALWAEIYGAGMGIGLGWLVSGLCFALFFWIRFLGGTAGWLELVLFVVGASCLALEVFVLPGFGLFGLAGGALVLLSLILASQTFYFPRNDYQVWRLTKSLLVLCGSGVAVLAFAAVLRQYLPRSPFFNRIVLEPPTNDEQMSAAAAFGSPAVSVGQRGRTLTPLVPSGKVRFGERLVDVVAEGEFIDPGSEVRVVEAMGNRIVVKKTS